jgi:hypothetical protein
MRKIIIVLIMILMMIPVMGICNDQYLGDDPTPHAKWVLERDGYTIVYNLKNLLERDEAERQAILEELKKQKMIEAQEKQERIQL